MAAEHIRCCYLVGKVAANKHVTPTFLGQSRGPPTIGLLQDMSAGHSSTTWMPATSLFAQAQQQHGTEWRTCLS
jgi:hypothetical protein